MSEEQISASDRMYRMIRDRAILEELPQEEWDSALADAMERADRTHVLNGAALDQLNKELADLRARGDEIRRRLQS